MNAQDTLQALREHPLLGQLDVVDLTALAAMARPCTLQPRQILFRQDEPARHFYLIRRGTLKLYLSSPEGEEKVLEVLGKGQMAAMAAAFMQPEAYPLTAEAIDEVELLEFPNDSFRALVKQSGSLALLLLGALSQRLHLMVGEIDRLSLHKATYRLVLYLLDKLEQQRGSGASLTLEAPKYVIASRLSITPETLSRTLGQLQRQGLVELQGDQLRILDEAGLRRLADAG
ncbi:MAG TPA: Crp/Fnr family transcriptional regulator [Chromatiales bacterium]|nr:Crp/Fnr family transcriptional regulator [Chromatiales bacterium]